MLTKGSSGMPVIAKHNASSSSPVGGLTNAFLERDNKSLERLKITNCHVLVFEMINIMFANFAMQSTKYR